MYAQADHMIKDLNTALNEAKRRRGVFSKTIIWESGVSKSQFYRIIKGEERPSAETKARLAESLGIGLEEFDTLFKRSSLEDPTPIERDVPIALNSKKNRRFLWLGSGILILGLFVLVLGNLQGQSRSTLQTDVVVEDDKTLFIEDVTIPDGTPIPVNTTFVKTWRVKNIGNVVWKDRYLKRMTPASDLICSSPAMVPIPETEPGETIDISVTFQTPHLPGSCRTDWKASDDRGNLFFPEKHGLFSIVTVVDK